jgi:hypothetical protein
MPGGSRSRILAHNSLVRFFQALLQQADLRPSVTESQVDPHSDSGTRGDIKFSYPIRRAPDLVVDVAITHPRRGVAEADGCIGSWKKQAVQAIERSKLSKHRLGYAAADISFVPLACSTYGAISPDTLRLLYLIVVKHLCVQERAEPQLIDRASVLRRGFLFSRARLMLGCMLAKAGAMRNLADGSVALPKLVFCRPGTVPVSCLLSDADVLYQAVGPRGDVVGCSGG